MLSVPMTLLLASAYIALLYSIAYRGERKPANQVKPYRYALAQGIHCTTWAFYGTVTQSAYYGWAMAPTYVGAIAVFLFAHRLQMRLLNTCKQQNLTSIADVITHRYGKTPSLGMVVAIIALIGIVPYIALQLRAVSGSFAAVTGVAGSNLPWFGDVSTLVALAMIGFAILFGTRRLSLAEQHSGLMDAVAFESAFKLLAFMAVGGFVSYQMFDGLGDLLQQAANSAALQPLFSGRSDGFYVYITHILLGAVSMFCLPRQFHVSYIENNDPEELRVARWAFPLYLFAINFFILPIALGGLLLVPEAASQDTFMLQLLLQAEQPLMTAIAFLGGLASATSMVIIATLALSIMMSSDVIMPSWLRLRQYRAHPVSFTPRTILRIRRATIAAIVLLAFGFHKLTEANLPLVNAGLLSLALLAQLAPALLGGLLWRRANRFGAILGISAGTLIWAWWLLLPSISPVQQLSDAALSDGVLLSLAVNTLLYGLAPWLWRTSEEEQQRSHSFSYPQSLALEHPTQQVTWGRLRQVLNRFFDSHELERMAQRLQLDLTSASADSWVPGPMVARLERELAAVIGTAASRMLLETISQQPGVPIAQAVTWATQASQLYKFNRELLQASVENIPQGISVIDAELRLVAWNRRYLELFQYPADFVHAGMPVADLLRYNAERGLLGDGEADPAARQSEIDKRLNYLRQGSSYRYQRAQGSRVIELQGAPMPGGGFVTTYTDITDLVAAQRQLEQVNLELEARVELRTAELLLAKQAEERAHTSKSKFFAAVSHDLMQPFNAATLFCDMLQRQLHGEPQVLAQQVQQSLHNAEELLTMLLDMTRLEAGNLPVHRTLVALDEVLQPLLAAQRVIAAEKQVRIDYRPSKAVLYTDRKLLSRVLQNILSNAVRYTDHGRILVAARRQGIAVRLHIIDTGRGIPADQRDHIFREFHQLQQEGDNPGLGLGLAIVERMCRLLEIQLDLRSQVGRGSNFSLLLPVHSWRPLGERDSRQQRPHEEQFLSGRQLWVVDNDPQMLRAVAQLLESWGAVVTRLSGREQLTWPASPPDLLLLDYHLDSGDTGIALLQTVRAHYQALIPAIVNSADPDEQVREQAIAEQAAFIPKPLKTAALKRLLKRLLG